MASTAADISRHEYRAIGLIGAGHFMSHFYQLCLPPLFIFVKPALGVSYAALGLVMTAFFVATAAVQVPVGATVDRMGARRVLVAGLALTGGGVALAGLGGSYAVLFGGFLLAGLGNAVFHPADFSILAATVREARLGRAFAVHTLGGSIGFAAAPAGMVLLATLWDWRTALVVAGLLGIAVAVLIAAAGETLQDAAPARREAADAETPAVRPTWRFMLSRPMVLFFLFYALTSASGTGMTNFSVVALVALYDTPLALANSALTAFLVAAMVGTLPGGFVAERVRRQEPVVIGCFVILAACIAAIGTGALSPWLVLAAVIAGGLMRGVYNAPRDILVKNAAPAGRIGTAFGFVTLGYTVGQGLTPVIYGWLMDIGSPAAVFYVSALFAVIAIATVQRPAGRAS